MDYKTSLKEYFHYTPIERKGIFLLLIIMLGVFGYYAFVKEKIEELNDEAYESEVALLKDAAAQNNLRGGTTQLFEFNPNTASFDDFIRLGLSKKTANIIKNYREKGGKFKTAEDFKKMYTLKIEDFNRLQPYLRFDEASTTDKTPKPTVVAQTFDFDPNTATDAELKLLGLPDKTIGILQNYRNKGGKFRKPEDFSKLFGLSDADKQRLIPFVKIAPSNSSTPTPPPIAANLPDKSQIPTEYGTRAKGIAPASSLTKVISNININQATIADWDALPGIGPTLAKFIVNYREKLGGFYSIEQISETQGLPDSTFQKIKPYLNSSPVFRKLNINTSSFEELNLHPYISDKQGKAIIMYRTNHGNFNNLNDVLKTGVITEQEFKKVKNYLSID